MECDEARRMLDRGTRPGSASAERTALGFHLSSCPACRGYRAAIDQRLLADLLARPGPAPRPAGAPVQRPSRRWKRYVAIAVALVAALLVILAVPSALALIAIGRNVQAMIVPTAPPSRTATPARAQASTQQPALSATPPAPPATRTAQATTVPSATVPRASITYSDRSIHEGHQEGEGSFRQRLSILHDLHDLRGFGRPDRRSRAVPAPSTPSPAPIARPAPTPTITPVPLGEVAPGAPLAARSSAAAPAPRDGPAPPAGAAITVLLLGVDQRPDESGPSRADAIVIARLDPARGRIALLSLPRDLIVDIPGYGPARINAASVYGDLYPELGGGDALIRRTVGELLGTPIDYVVRVNFDGFVGAIDAIGGITVDVPEELYDPEYPTMDYGYRVAHFTPGPQHMDGATALVYSRIRHMDSTYARNRRQQAVMLAVLERLREQNALQQLQSVASITTALRDYVQTDMPMDRIVDLAWAFHGIAPGSVERYALDESMVAEQVLPEDPYATFALPGAIESLARKLLGAATRYNVEQHN